jgi:SAM-dependent methyltransferase
MTDFDLVFAVCVLHHVVAAARHQFATELARVARPGGIVAIFEHNAWNPPTRLTVARCKSEDADLLRMRQAVRLLKIVGLNAAEQAFISWFPGVQTTATARSPAFCSARSTTSRLAPPPDSYMSRLHRL